jgi:hypothetical protein
MLALYITTLSNVTANPRAWIIVRQDGVFEAFIRDHSPERKPNRDSLNKAGYGHLPSTEIIDVTRPFWNSVASEG